MLSYLRACMPGLRPAQPAGGSGARGPLSDALILTIDGGIHGLNCPLLDQDLTLPCTKTRLGESSAENGTASRETTESLIETRLMALVGLTGQHLKHCLDAEGPSGLFIVVGVSRSLAHSSVNGLQVFCCKHHPLPPHSDSVRRPAALNAILFVLALFSPPPLLLLASSLAGRAENRRLGVAVIRRLGALQECAHRDLDVAG